ncbi:N-acetylglucosamine-specific PTS transporter subunit IIBC [Candidatus Avelusimicrobium luingense]|uniref:N-acetylglucosamine-specific PTS transporter subunit IIBC n=1 Tax=Candidatus Avelusimicrobium luingense TaxID=3416211 RepID=UPI003D09CC63
MTTNNSLMKKLGAGLVQLGRALMLPIAVLPIAGLLLRLGQPDLLNIAFVSAAGNAVFSNLPLIFAIGVAVGFAKESHGASALAAFIGYMILTAALKTLDESIDMGVMGGIIVGITAGLLYNRFHTIKLPPYLAFFGGRRFVPIITGGACLLIAAIAYFVWPPIGHAINAFGQWTIGSGNIGLFFFGLANRLLIPLGLHHILNNLVWFQFGDFATVQNGINTVVHGDLARFFAQDPTAGIFMTGFFPVMMFGLPAACLAMLHTANTTRQKATAGLLLSMALTSFLTGITEPIEFAFMFVAFPLYLLHAVLTGVSMVVMNVLGVKLGFTFSAGLFDYLLSFGLSSKPLWLIPVGIVWGLIYYVIFYVAIIKWNLQTPGREEIPAAATTSTPQPVETPAASQPQQPLTRGQKYVQALGGKDNIKTLGACATRLRLEIADVQKVDETALKALGARGVLKTASGQVQVIIGPDVEFVADEIKPYLN